MGKDKQIKIPENELGMSGYSTFAWKLWEKGLCTMAEAEQADQIMRKLGYRKASDVAREIFADLKQMWDEGRGFIKYPDLVRLERLYEQKYTEGGNERQI